MKRIILIMLLLLIGISGCGSQQDVAKERAAWADKSDDSIVIGVVGTMWVMDDATKYLDGIKLAVEEINTDGGINQRKIEILAVDDKGQTMEGINIAQELVGTPNLMAVLGHWDSHVTLPAASIYENAGVLMITAMATTPKLTQTYHNYIFRNVPSDEIMGGEMAKFAKEQKFKRMVIYYSDNDYGRGLANSFEKVAQNLGVSIVDRATDFVNEYQFQETMKKWGALDFDGVFIADLMPDAGDFIIKLKAVYPYIPIMGTDGLDHPDFINLLGKSAEEIVIATLFNPNTENPEIVNFIARFKAYYGTEPDVYAVQGYETMKLLAAAMESAGSPDPVQTAKALREINQWPGITGTLTVEDNGDVTGKVIHKKVVRNGKFEYLSIPQQ